MYCKSIQLNLTFSAIAFPTLVRNALYSFKIQLPDFEVKISHISKIQRFNKRLNKVTSLFMKLWTKMVFSLVKELSM